MGTNKETGEPILKPIEKLINWEKRRGRWVFSQQFYELMIMDFWHVTPPEWKQLEEEDKAIMIAFYNSKNMIMDYQNYLDEMKR